MRTIEEDNVSFSLHDRIVAVQKGVRKTTEEALKKASFQQQHHQLPSSGDEAAATKAATDASFLLGMDLFGQEASALEREVRSKLQELETEMEVLVELQSNTENVEPQQQPAISSEEDDGDGVNPEFLLAQSTSLRQRIAFLKECSLARSLLDEATTLSSSALSAEPSWVQASQRLVQATEKVSIARELLEQRSDEKDTMTINVGYQILDSIRTAIRSQRVALVTKATSLIESSITITANTMLVRGSTQLQEAFQVLMGLSGETTTIPSSDKQEESSSIGPFRKESLSSMSSSSALENSIRKLTNSLMDTVFQPVLESHRLKMATGNPWTVSKASDKLNKGLIGVSTASKGTVHSLEWHQELNTENDQKEQKSIVDSTIDAIYAWSATLKWMEQILTFVQKCVLFEQESLCRLVGARLFGEPNAFPSSLKVEALGLQSHLLGGDNGILMESLVERVAETCIPTYLEPQQLDQLSVMGKKLLSFCFPFCRLLVDKKFIPFDGSKPPRLVHFCHNFESNYVDNRRCLLLNQARNVLMNDDYHNTVTVGVDVAKHSDATPDLGMDNGMAVFLLHKSSISETSSKIIKLVRKAMDEAVAQQQVPPTSSVEHENYDEEDQDSALALLSPTLYRTAREILSLFRSIIPAAHGVEVAQIPRTAAVLHNDCVFLAHNCLTLGLEYKERFPAPREEDARGKLLKQTCMFVDMVPLFREMADRSMGDMLDLQKNQIAEIVGSRITFLGKALASDESLHEWSEAETALAAGIYHLRHLSQAWKPILSTSVFTRSIQYLADVIFTLYLDQVTSTQTKAISPSACNFCSALFAKATEEIGRMLQDDVRGTVLKSPVSETTRSHVWEHFVAIGRFMDMSLNDIVTALANGVFRQVEGQELSRLIIATFQDSPKRETLLDTLANYSVMNN